MKPEIEWTRVEWDEFYNGCDSYLEGEEFNPKQSPHFRAGWEKKRNEMRVWKYVNEPCYEM